MMTRWVKLTPQAKGSLEDSTPTATSDRIRMVLVRSSPVDCVDENRPLAVLAEG